MPTPDPMYNHWLTRTLARTDKAMPKSFFDVDKELRQFTLVSLDQADDLRAWING